MWADAVSKAVEAMVKILKLQQAQFAGDTQKPIKSNVENIVGYLKDEQMGKIIDLYV